MLEYEQCWSRMFVLHLFNNRYTVNSLFLNSELVKFFHGYYVFICMKIHQKCYFEFRQWCTMFTNILFVNPCTVEVKGQEKSDLVFPLFFMSYFLRTFTTWHSFLPFSQVTNPIFHRKDCFHNITNVMQSHSFTLWSFRLITCLSTVLLFRKNK